MGIIVSARTYYSVLILTVYNLSIMIVFSTLTKYLRSSEGEYWEDNTQRHRFESYRRYLAPVIQLAE